MHNIKIGSIEHVCGLDGDLYGGCARLHVLSSERYAHVYACLHAAHTYACMHACMHACCTYLCMHACMHAAHVYVCMHALSSERSAHIYACMHACMMHIHKSDISRVCDRFCEFGPLPPPCLHPLSPCAFSPPHRPLPPPLAQPSIVRRACIHLWHSCLQLSSSSTWGLCVRCCICGGMW